MILLFQLYVFNVDRVLTGCFLGALLAKLRERIWAYIAGDVLGVF